MTSMPRQAKSMASVSPTGPPPTISTLVLIPPISRDGVCPPSLAWSGQAEKVRRLPLKDLPDYDLPASKNAVALGAIGGPALAAQHGL